MGAGDPDDPGGLLPDGDDDLDEVDPGQLVAEMRRAVTRLRRQAVAAMTGADTATSDGDSDEAGDDQ